MNHNPIPSKILIKNKTFSLLFPYLLLVTLSLGIFAILTHLWEIDIRIPIGNVSGDALISLFTVKNIADHGWYLRNDNLAAPFGLDFYDFPMIEGFHFLLIKIILFLLGEQNYAYVIAFNLYFILGFILSSITCYIVAQKLKLPVGISIIVSILYSFQPYHFYRFTGHYFLSAYYLVPVALLIMIWLINGEIFWKNDFNRKFEWNKQSIICLICCLMISSSGAYYAIFTCFFILVTTLINFCRRKYLANLINSSIVIGTICLGFFANLIPNLIYWSEEGRNAYVASRIPWEADIYSLKIAQILLPIQNHRFSWLRSLREQYDQAFIYNNNEGSFASLGILGSIGFLFLLTIPFIYINRNKYKFIVFYLSLFTYSAIFLGQTGGFGSLFNLYVSPQIRAYNRISIFVSLFALLSFGFLIKRVLEKLNFKPKLIICSLLLILGIYDQSPMLPMNHEAIKDNFMEEKNFIEQIENQVPQKAMIYQLPYMFFPENPPVSVMGSYDLLRGYLHSENLKWSFGSSQGRNYDWHKWISELPIDEQLTILSSIGFQGIYLDSNGYIQGSQELQDLKNTLENRLAVQPTESARKDLLFYNMQKYNQVYQEKYSTIPKDLWLHPKYLDVDLSDGFYQRESNPNEKWNWSSNDSVIKITNNSDDSRELNLEMKLQTGWSEKSNLTVTSDFWEESYLINNEPLMLHKKLSIPPGKHLLRFHSNARQVDAPLDSRALFFRVINLSFEDSADQERMDLLKKVSQDLSTSLIKSQETTGQNTSFSSSP